LIFCFFRRCFSLTRRLAALAAGTFFLLNHSRGGRTT